MSFLLIFLLAGASPGGVAAQSSRDRDGETEGSPGSSSVDEPPLPLGLEEDSDAPSQSDGSGDSDDDEPPLPAGLGGDSDGDEPALPAGLGGDSSDGGEPALPAGLGGGGDEMTTSEPTRSKTLKEWLAVTGYGEIRWGVRVQDDPHEKRTSLGETRVQFEFERFFLDGYTFQLVADVVTDDVLEDQDLDLERGRGAIDLREVNLLFSPLDFMDVKIGRQILTWGTGDLLFLNDLFPKDWQAILIGRDIEYVKAPSDALKVSLFSGLANLDVVFVPRFDSDRFITGERLSYYNPLLMGRAGNNAIQEPVVPDEWFEDHEWHLRLSKNLQGLEVAAYGYWGHWKTPSGFDMMTQQAIFPALSTYGASMRDLLGSGVANLEVAYYDSRDDRDGLNPFIPNNEMRLLAGYERQLPELVDNLTIGLQYYLEWMMEYEEYLWTAPPGFPLKDEVRHVVTARIVKRLLNQNLTLTLFTYYSPSDEDIYLRPKMEYKLDDRLRVTAGGNLIFGAEDYTFFNQFEKNSNLYTGIRYSF